MAKNLYLMLFRIGWILTFIFEFQPPKSVVSAGFADESRERAYIVTGPDIDTRIGWGRDLLNFQFKPP